MPSGTGRKLLPLRRFIAARLYRERTIAGMPAVIHAVAASIGQPSRHVVLFKIGLGRGVDLISLAATAITASLYDWLVCILTRLHTDSYRRD